MPARRTETGNRSLLEIDRRLIVVNFVPGKKEDEGYRFVLCRARHFGARTGRQ